MPAIERASHAHGTPIVCKAAPACLRWRFGGFRMAGCSALWSAACEDT
jgi:hypothetical protein